MRAASAGRSTGTPSSLAYMMRTRSSGRGRLPVCVVRKRSVLRIIDGSGKKGANFLFDHDVSENRHRPFRILLKAARFQPKQKNPRRFESQTSDPRFERL